MFLNTRLPASPWAASCRVGGARAYRARVQLAWVEVTNVQLTYWTMHSRASQNGVKHREGVGGAEAVIATKSWQLQNLEGVSDYAHRKM